MPALLSSLQINKEKSRSTSEPGPRHGRSPVRFMVGSEAKAHDVRCGPSSYFTRAESSLGEAESCREEEVVVDDRTSPWPESPSSLSDRRTIGGNSRRVDRTSVLRGLRVFV